MAPGPEHVPRVDRSQERARRRRHRGHIHAVRGLLHLGDVHRHPHAERVGASGTLRAARRRVVPPVDHAADDRGTGPSDTSAPVTVDMTPDANEAPSVGGHRGRFVADEVKLESRRSDSVCSSCATGSDLSRFAESSREFTRSWTTAHDHRVGRRRASSVPTRGPPWRTVAVRRSSRSRWSEPEDRPPRRTRCCPGSGCSRPDR